MRQLLSQHLDMTQRLTAKAVSSSGTVIHAGAIVVNGVTDPEQAATLIVGKIESKIKSQMAVDNAARGSI